MSEEMVIKHCAPTLAGLKTGNMFSCIFKNTDELRNAIRRLNKAFADKGVRIVPLRHKDNRALIYVFRPEYLKRDLNDVLVCRILEERGYCCKTPEKCVIRLIRRLKESREFPHEAGLFLGFPPEDVRGFIENDAKSCKCVGYWKVYGDEDKARKLFERYRKCSEIYWERFEKGYTLDKLTVAKKSAG